MSCIVELSDLYEIKEECGKVYFRKVGDEDGWEIAYHPQKELQRLIGWAVEDALNYGPRIVHSNADYIFHDQYLRFHIYNKTLKFKINITDLEQLPDLYNLILAEVKDTLEKYPEETIEYEIEDQEEKEEQLL